MIRGGCYVVSLCLVSAALWARPTPWILITKSNDGEVSFYAEPKSLAIKADQRTMRWLYDYRQIQENPDTLVENLSALVTVAADCENRRLATVQSTSYAKHMASGEIVGVSKTLPPSQLRYVRVTKDSVDEKVLKYICSAKAAAAAI